jgi:hypothetical protein
VHSLLDWIYSTPTWLSGTIIVLGAVAISLLALTCFHRFVPPDIRRAHNDVAGFIVAIIGVINAVLLAFIAVSAWENFKKAEEAAELEANMVDNLCQLRRAPSQTGFYCAPVFAGIYSTGH